VIVNSDTAPFIHFAQAKAKARQKNKGQRQSFKSNDSQAYLMNKDRRK